MTAPQVSPAVRRREVMTIYAIGLFQGLSLVAFPAAAARSHLHHRLRPVQEPVRRLVPATSRHGHHRLAGPAGTGPPLRSQTGAPHRAGRRHHRHEPARRQLPLPRRYGRLPRAAGRNGLARPGLRAHPRVDQHLRRRVHARPQGRGADLPERTAGSGHGAVPAADRRLHRHRAVVVPAAIDCRRARGALRGLSRSADGPTCRHGQGRQSEDSEPVLALCRRAGDLRAGRDHVRQLGDDPAGRPRT